MTIKLGGRIFEFTPGGILAIAVLGTILFFTLIDRLFG